MDILEFDRQVQADAEVFCEHLLNEVLLLAGRWQHLTNEACAAGHPPHLILASLHHAIGDVQACMDTCKEMSTET